MEHNNFPDSKRSNWLLYFQRVVAFLGIFFLGRFSYVNNTENHDKLIGVAILALTVVLYLIIERSVRNQIVTAVSEVQTQQAAQVRSIIKQVDVSLRKKQSDSSEKDP